MKIKRNVAKEEKFSEVRLGTVFISNDTHYMKTETIEMDYGDAFNAVSLETGGFDEFGDEDLVCPCYDAELVIP